jgi:hypothetical protein
MALYSGSFYNYKSNFDIIQYVSLDKINNSYTVYNFSSYFSASIYNQNLLSLSSSNVLTAFNENQTVNLENINGNETQIEIIYYQRVYSSGLNDWSYYKTSGSVNKTPNSQDTIPPYSGSILFHEVIGSLNIF